MSCGIDNCDFSCRSRGYLDYELKKNCNFLVWMKQNNIILMRLYAAWNQLKKVRIGEEKISKKNEDMKWQKIKNPHAQIFENSCSMLL